MIQLKINHMDHKAVLTVPADYERVTLALWTLGLDRDPEKYTLRQLDAEFTYAIEAMGTRYGVVKTRVANRNWTGWCKSPYITYVEEAEAQEPA